MERNKETWQQIIFKALERRGAHTLGLQWSDLQLPREVNLSRKAPKLAVRRCTSKITTTTQVTYTKGWSEGRKRAGERLRIVAKKGSIMTADKASAPRNDQDLKKKATEVVDLQPSPKGQRDVYSQSGLKDFRFTELVVQDHEVAVRVPRYVVSESVQLGEEEQDLEWILGVVQRSYIEEQSNTRMYDVLFADGNRKCIPSGFTEQILRHEKNAIQPTNNVEPTCNISSDDESEDDDGSRDGDDSWPVTYENDLHDETAEWEAWAQSLGAANTKADCQGGIASTAGVEDVRSPVRVRAVAPAKTAQQVSSDIFH
jgi:hypothetical protein